jgi:hypothetical protein
MAPQLVRILGPRIPAGDLARPRYIAPALLLFVAAAMLIASWWMPYWRMTLLAPQYPKGLHVQAYLNRLEGDVREIDGLNHYIGMRPLNDAATLERQTSLMALGAMALLLVAGLFVHNRWAALLALPALVFPAAFLLDLFYWLHMFGQNLDPDAALSSSIKPFTPPVLGTGSIGQFTTIASVAGGWWMGLGASAVMVAALWMHRRAFKPLVEARMVLQQRAPVTSTAEARKAMAA